MTCTNYMHPDGVYCWADHGAAEAADDRGAADVLCGDRNLCARPYRHDGPCRSFAGAEWDTPRAVRG